MEGLNRLVSIKGSLNHGLSPLLKSAFPDSINTNRPLVSRDAQNIPDPNWVAGFTNGEGCFFINTYKDEMYKSGWRVKLSYEIHLHRKDLYLLEKIQKFFDTGKIYNSSTASKYVVYSVTGLQKIIQHFDKYTLFTQKRADFELLKQAFTLVQNKEHLTRQGLEKIIAIKASMNNGLSEELKGNFPNIASGLSLRPVIRNTVEPDPNWLAGFTSAEGSFLVRTYKAGTKTGEAVKIVFQLAQHVRDEQLIRSFINYFNCGIAYKSEEAFVYRVEKFSYIKKIILPFFDKYQVQGVKRLDYLDFCKVAEFIDNKSHLTQEGLSQIKNLKVGMNKGRLWKE